MDFRTFFSNALTFRSDMPRFFSQTASTFAATIAFSSTCLHGQVTESEQNLVSVEIGGQGQGWQTLGESDFVNANCKEHTWKWTPEKLFCNGDCVGVLRSKKQFTNFELALQWKHLESAGNSGVFVWTPAVSVDALKAGKLPEGIECQVLDHGFTEKYLSKPGAVADWFTTNGDVFPVGKSKMKPFPPLSPNGVRSFPSGNHSNKFGQWNDYYIRAINGEVRLWVNGHEVSGGSDCEPASGYVCLEAEGAPIEFRKIRLRELP